MRIRLATRPAALFGAMLVVMLLALLPMRAALGWIGADDDGLVVRTASGSVWDGRLTDVRFGGLALGDMDAAVSPFALLLGRARIALDGRDPAQAIHGAASLSRHGVAVDSMTAHVPTGSLFAPVPVSAIDLDTVSVRFRDGQCESADGRVTATLASGGIAGIALPATLSGPARCDGGSLLVPLVSQAGTEGITIRITGAGSYHADLSLRPGDPAAVARLTGAGFAEQGGAYRLSIDGRFRQS
ncbi:type II secretion system protein N [uncultured Sphingomonas sp.]|uniref:type II secretion system protein N n=1 Tax=uncultured Sphingomonas sp. TaxID=158754 RepID=UPI0035CA34A6